MPKRLQHDPMLIYCVHYAAPVDGRRWVVGYARERNADRVVGNVLKGRYQPLAKRARALGIKPVSTYRCETRSLLEARVTQAAAAVLDHCPVCGALD
jgi:hypothetical protein